MLLIITGTPPGPLPVLSSPHQPATHILTSVYVVTEVCTPLDSHGETWNATHGVFTTLTLAKRAARYLLSDIKRYHGHDIDSKEWLSKEDGTIQISVDWLDTVIDVEMFPLWAMVDGVEGEAQVEMGKQRVERRLFSEKRRE